MPSLLFLLLLSSQLPPPSTSASASAACPSIRERLLSFDEQRTRLSLEYLRQHSGLSRTSPTIEPKILVIHWTALPDLEGSWQVFRGPRLPASRAGIARGGALNVSTHFLVDRDGTIWRLLDPRTFARHVIGLNHVAVGIDNVGGGQAGALTQAQLEANVRLVACLKGRYPGLEWLIGHHEYRAMEGTPLWREADPSYRTTKQDPGPDFMTQLRRALAAQGVRMKAPPRTATQEPR